MVLVGGFDDMDGFMQIRKVEVLFDTQHGHSGQYTIESHRKGPK